MRAGLGDKTMKKRNNVAVRWVTALAGTALVTTATCDPFTGAIDFFRDDDLNAYADTRFVWDELIVSTDYYESDCFFLFDCW